MLVGDPAASRLQLADYYRRTNAPKHDWQGLQDLPHGLGRADLPAR